MMQQNTHIWRERFISALLALLFTIMVIALIPNEKIAACEGFLTSIVKNDKQ